MFKKFPQAIRFGRPFDEISSKVPDKEKEISEKLSRIEESYVDAAIMKTDGSKSSLKRYRSGGFTN